MQTKKIEAGPRLPLLGEYDNDATTRMRFAAWAHAMFGVTIEWAQTEVPRGEFTKAGTWLALVTCSDHVFAALADLGKGWRTVRVYTLPPVPAETVSGEGAASRAIFGAPLRVETRARCISCNRERTSGEDGRGCDPEGLVSHVWEYTSHVRGD